jgi:tRNA (cmo5U34)-methyltransferase
MAEDNSFQEGELTFDYDLANSAIPHHDLVQLAVADAIRAYSLEKGDRNLEALEIGTGTGKTAKRVLEAVTNLRLICLDCSENMLAQAKIKLAQARVTDRVIFKKSSALEYLSSTDDEKYDVIFSAYTIHNMPALERRRLLPEIWRVLKKGGIFVLSDKIAVDDPKTHKLNVEWYLETLETFFARDKQQTKQELIDHTYFDEREGIKWTEADARRDLLNAGFKQVKQLYREKMEAGFQGIK